MEFRLLGPLDVRGAAGDVPVGGPRTRALLCALLMRPDEVVSSDQLIDALWGEHPPPGALHALHAQASKLRAALRVDPGSNGGLIDTAPGGYRLHLDGHKLDLLRFEELVGEGRRRLDSGATCEAVAALREAEGMWRGTPLSEFGDADFVQPTVTRMVELHRAAIETRLAAQLADGESASLVAELEGRVAGDPLREQLRGLLMLALYRSGRQARALEVYRDTRGLLADELGVDPSRELQDLHLRILSQDPTLTIEPSAPPTPPAAAAHETSTAVPSASPRRRSRRHGWLAVATVLVLGGATVTVVLANRGDGHRPVAVLDANVVGEYDTGGHLIRQIPVGTNPTSITAAAGSLWVTNAADNTVTRIDPQTGTVTATIADVGDGPAGVAVGGGIAWVVSPAISSPLATATADLTAINTTTDAAAPPVTAGLQAGGIAYGAGRVWVAVTGAGQIYSFPPHAPTSRQWHDVGMAPTGIVAGARAVWVTDAGDDTVWELDPVTGKPVRRPIPVGLDPTSVVVTHDDVWVANHLDGTVTHLDAATGTTRRTINVGDGPSGVAVAAGAVWVTTQYAGELSRIDPATDVVTEKIRVPGAPNAVAAVGDRIFVASAVSYRNHRGGTLRVVFGGYTPGSPFPVIDPAAYGDFIGVLVAPATTDSLVAYTKAPGPAGAVLVPDLADALPSANADTTQYLFHLRLGIRFSTGRLVQAHDVRSSIERAVREGWQDPGSPLSAIVGAAACLKRAAKNRRQAAPPCDLSAGIRINDARRTVRFVLTRPDPQFLTSLADIATAIVPSGTPVVSATAAFGSAHPVVTGTGPYMVSRFDWPHHIVLTRNPYFRQWSRAAQPDGYADTIDIRVTASSPKNLADLQHGRIDYLDDQDIAPAQVQDTVNRYPVALHDEGSPAVGMAFLNITVPPFDNLLARRAVNFAVDRTAIIAARHRAESYVPACQVIPRGVSGFRPYCPYTVAPNRDGRWSGPDIATARRLVRESGTRNERVTVWGSPSTNDPTPGLFVKALTEIGYRARLHPPIAQFGDYLDEITKHPAQIGMIAYTDSASGSAAVSNFICGGPGNFGNFCDPAIDVVYQRARTLEVSDRPAADILLAKVDRMLVDDAALVPIWDTNRFALTAARVGNWTASTQWGPQLAQLWVK